MTEDNELSNQQLYEQALAAIKKLYADQRVDAQSTLIALQSLREEIEVMMDALI